MPIKPPPPKRPKLQIEIPGEEMDSSPAPGISILEPDRVDSESPSRSSLSSAQAHPSVPAPTPPPSPQPNVKTTPAPTSPPAPQEDILDQFVVSTTEVLGQGADAELRVASDPLGVHPDQVAKVAKDRPDAIESLKKEHEILTHLGPHPNLIGVRGFSANPPTLFLEKADLALNTTEAMSAPLNERLGYIAGITRGLASMHSKRATHGDLSPKNILLCKGEAKLCDFGETTLFPPGVDKISRTVELTPEVSVKETKAFSELVAEDLEELVRLSFNLIIGEKENPLIPPDPGPHLKEAFRDYPNVDTTRLSALVSGVQKKEADKALLQGAVELLSSLGTFEQGAPPPSFTIPHPLEGPAQKARDAIISLWDNKNAQIKLVDKSFEGPETGVPDALLGAVSTRVSGSPQALRDLLCAEKVKLKMGQLNLGSGGDEGQAYVAANANEEVNAFFVSLFECITSTLEHELDTADLFHGHMFVCGPDSKTQTGPHQGELGILFHAKEYPNDLQFLVPSPKSSSFTTHDAPYRDRNILYLASQNKFYVLSPGTNSPSSTDLLIDAMPGANMDLLLGNDDYRSIQEASFSVDESLFYQLGERVFDVNLIEDQLFFKP